MQINIFNKVLKELKWYQDHMWAEEREQLMCLGDWKKKVEKKWGIAPENEWIYQTDFGEVKRRKFRQRRQ